LPAEGSVADFGASWCRPTQENCAFKAGRQNDFDNPNPTSSCFASHQCTFRAKASSVSEPVAGLLLLPLAFAARRRRKQASYHPVILPRSARGRCIAFGRGIIKYRQQPACNACGQTL